MKKPALFEQIDAVQPFIDALDKLSASLGGE
jgi:hypothetical protein